MKKMEKRIYIIMSILVFVVNIAAVACAEDNYKTKYDLGQVVVTATKTEVYQSEVGSSVSVITGKDMKASGKKTVLEVLEEVPGVYFTQNGSQGGQASAYLRGAIPGQSLVLIDGVEVNDPISAARAFNFAHLTTDNIERIEIVRGPQSTLYGSDAMGGVINIITKKGKGKLNTQVSLEAGSHRTFRESFSALGSTDIINYSVGASRIDSDGISKATDGKEDDAYKNVSVSSRVGVKVLDEGELLLALRYNDAEFDFDDGAYQDDPNYTSASRQFSSKLQLDHNITDNWNQRLALYFMDIKRSNRDLADSVDTTDDMEDKYTADNRKLEIQQNFSLFDIGTQTVGYEYEEERGTSDYRLVAFTDRINRKSVDNEAYYFQSQLKATEDLSFLLGTRVDDHERSGKQTTYKVSSLYSIFQTDTRLKANFGTGFKAPSIYQLYSSYGNTNLKPDESRSYDFGLEQGLFDGKVFCAATYFYNNFKNMIDFDLVTWKYKNVGRAKTSGMEFESKVNCTDSVSLTGSYTHMKTKDEDTGLELIRRPKQKLSLGTNWACSEKANLNIFTNYVGTSWNDQINVQKNKRYFTVDLAFNYDLNEYIELFSKVINIFDRKYQQVQGFNALDRSFYLGIKGKF